MAIYHSVRGSVDYTVVGEPAIVDGVASGFNMAGSNYVYVSYAGATISSKIEFGIQFTTGSVSNEQCVFRGQDNLYLCNLFITNSKLLTSIFPEFTYASRIQLEGTTTLTAHTSYWVKIVLETGKAAVYLSTDGVNYTLENEQTITVTWPSSFTSTHRNEYGFYGAGSTLNFDGSIDLHATYIKVNGQPWFGICPVEVKHINYQAPVSYELVGSPTISNGVVSNFSANDYVHSEEFFPYSSNMSMELCIKYSNWTDGRIFRLGAGSSTAYNLRYGSNGKFRYYALDTVYTTDASIADYSYVKLTTSNGLGNNVAIQVSTDGTNWTNTTLTAVSGTQTEPGTNLTAVFGRTITGSIDFNETYIKINGKLWMFHPETNYLVKDDKLVFADQGLYLTGPVNYTVVGSPTIVDGVASGFSGSDYVQSSSTFPGSTAASLEFSTKFNISSFASASTIVSSTSGTIPFHLAVLDGKFKLYPGRESTYKVGDFVLSANTDYFIKLFWDSTNGWKLQYSTDGINYTTDFENYNPSNSAPKDNYVVIGRNYPNGGQEELLGTLDLNETYIKVNNELWFYGKNYASKNIAPVPAGYTYGVTTTTAIGYVDMRTQQFTAAPSGATIGRDE